jgi:hypothetical protein
VDADVPALESHLHQSGPKLVGLLGERGAQVKPAIDLFKLRVSVLRHPRVNASRRRLDPASPPDLGQQGAEVVGRVGDEIGVGWSHPARIDY